MGGSKLRRLWEGSMVFDWRRLFSLPARMETFLLSGSVSRTGENITHFLVFGKVHLFAQVKAKCVVTRSQVTRMPFHCLSDVETLKSNLTFIRHLTRNWALLSLWQKARFCFNASPSRVNVNCNHGWALRRAIRWFSCKTGRRLYQTNGYSGIDMPRCGRRLWPHLESLSPLQIPTDWLHSTLLPGVWSQIFISLWTSFRFGVPEAITLLLRQPGILVNSRTIQVDCLCEIGSNDFPRVPLHCWSVQSMVTWRWWGCFWRTRGWTWGWWTTRAGPHPSLHTSPSQDGARSCWCCRLQLHQRDEIGDPRAGEKRDGAEELAEECSEEKVDDETRWYLSKIF